MTKSGIEHDLSISPYVCIVDYGTKEYKYYFSSVAAMSRFESQMESNRRYIADTLERRFKMGFFISKDFCDVQLYKKIETRGFRINANGREITCLAGMSYNGRELERLS